MAQDSGGYLSLSLILFLIGLRICQEMKIHCTHTNISRWSEKSTESNDSVKRGQGLLDFSLGVRVLLMGNAGDETTFRAVIDPGLLLHRKCRKVHCSHDFLIYLFLEGH